MAASLHPAPADAVVDFDRDKVVDVDISNLGIKRAPQLWKDMPVLVMSGAPNFDPARHEDPMRFDITRTARRDTMAFGYGVHHCIGMTLARMNTRIAIGGMATRFSNMRLADPDFQPVITGNVKERGIAPVPLLLD